MKKWTQYVLMVLIVSLSAGLSGCATVKGLLASDNVANLAPEDYAKAVAEIQKIIGKKTTTSPVDGFTFQRVYRYRGAVCEAKDITWEDVYSKLSTAEKDGVPPVTTTVTNGTADSVEAAVDEIADVLADLGLGDTK